MNPDSRNTWTAPLAPLPIALKFWSRIGRATGAAAVRRQGMRMGRRQIRSGRLYRSPDGFAFAIDRDDRFQVEMLLDLYDPVVNAVIRRYTPPAGTVIDAGAHLGYFSMRFARQVGASGSVHAFECDPRLLPRLRAHVERNCLEWITVHPVGLLDRGADDVPLYLPAQLGWATTIEDAWAAVHKATVTMVALDDYLVQHGIAPEQLSFVKLDVEGSELQALLGARQTLAASSAPVLVEFIPHRLRMLGNDPDDLLALMSELGYQPFSPTLTKTGRLRLHRGPEPAIGEDVLFLKQRGVS